MWSGIIKCDCLLSWTLTAVGLACSGSLSVPHAGPGLLKVPCIPELILDSCLVSPLCDIIAMAAESSRVPVTPTVLIQPWLLFQTRFAKTFKTLFFWNFADITDVPCPQLNPCPPPPYPVFTPRLIASLLARDLGTIHHLVLPFLSLVPRFFHFYHLLVSKFYSIPSISTDII